MCPSLTPWVASSLNIEMMTFTVLFSMSSSSAPRLRPPPFSIEVTIKNVPVCLFRGEVNNPSHENFLLRKNPLKVAFNFVGIQLWAENLKLAHELHNTKALPNIFCSAFDIPQHTKKALSPQQRKRMIKQNTFVLQCCTSASSQTAKIGPLRLPALQTFARMFCGCRCFWTALSQMFLGCRTTSLSFP